MKKIINCINIKRVGIVLFLLLFLTATRYQTFAFYPVSKLKDEGAKVFDYNHSVALDLKVESSRDEDGVSIKDISYAPYAATGNRVKAFLISPAGKGPFAAVMFFHWYGRPNGNRNQFVKEAVALAKQGTVSLLIQGYFPWGQAPTDAVADRQRVIDQTIEVRRGLDLLLSQPGVDKKRVAYVGHDYGAMYGANLAGADNRVKNYILIAGTGSFSQWSLNYWLAKSPDADKAAYRKSLSEVDPATQIARAKSAKFFFQFASSDEHITQAEATTFSNAANKSKEIKWYEGKHELDVESARIDRHEWLTRQLKLSKSK